MAMAVRVCMRITDGKQTFQYQTSLPKMPFPTSLMIYIELAGAKTN